MVSYSSTCTSQDVFYYLCLTADFDKLMASIIVVISYRPASHFLISSRFERLTSVHKSTLKDITRRLLICYSVRSLHYQQLFCFRS